MFIISYCLLITPYVSTFIIAEQYYICDNDPSFIIKDEQGISYKGSYELITHTFYIGYK